jgi:hypothetical protein
VITAYRTLWTVAVHHEFRAGACDDLAFIVPAATREALAGMRALVREHDGVLRVLIGVDDEGEPLGECTGRRLVFGLAPRDAWFVQYTAPLAIGPGETPLFANEASPDALDPTPRGVELTGPLPQITPRLAARPVDLSVATPSGSPLTSARLQATDATWQFRGASEAGEVVVSESAAGGQTATRRLFIEPTLAAMPAWGLLSLTASAAHVATGCTFTLSFAARTDTLRYYLVVKPTNDDDLDSIHVEDNGAAADGRPTIAFNRVLPAAFGAGHLSPALLDAGGTRQIVLFEAQSPVARRARGPHGFELHRNGEVLIGALPQPGAERSDAQFVVHLSKP